jgi:hypothetical protein
MSFEDLTGKVLGCLRVIQFAGRDPVRWHVTCTKCNTRWTETHERLRQNPACRNVACLKRTEQELRAPGIVRYVPKEPETARLYWIPSDEETS